MNYLLRFKLFLDELETKTYYRAVAVGAAAIACIFMILFYWHAGKIASLEKELKNINRNRERVREILAQHERVKNQKYAVAEILASERTFKIKDSFSRILSETHLENRLSKETEISESPEITSEYKEIKLNANFRNITMQELVNLLSIIEKNNRIYTKELDILKASESAKIDVNLIIATLLEKTGGT